MLGMEVFELRVENEEVTWRGIHDTPTDGIHDALTEDIHDCGLPKP